MFNFYFSKPIYTHLLCNHMPKRLKKSKHRSMTKRLMGTRKPMTKEQKAEAKKKREIVKKVQEEINKKTKFSAK